MDARLVISKESLSEKMSSTNRSSPGCYNANRGGVATISRLLNITGLFCRISSLSYGSFAKTTEICVQIQGPDNRVNKNFDSLV